MNASRASKTVPPRQLAALRTQLEEQRRFRLQQLVELRGIDPHSYSEVTEVLASGAHRALRDVLAALRRIDEGTYGRCTECGQHLPLERLEVLPQVAECLACSRRSGDRPAH